MTEPEFSVLEVVRLPERLGTVVEVHVGGVAFEVEFANEDGETIAVVTLPAALLEATGKADP